MDYRQISESVGFSQLGSVYPLIDISGTPYECGWQLGVMWQEILRERAQKCESSETPWWAEKNGEVARLIDSYAPHLRDIMRGMQAGAGLGEKPIPGWDVGSAKGTQLPPVRDDCTSFAIQPAHTVDSAPISGQNMDSKPSRHFRRQVLRFQPKGFPSFLHTVYPGHLVECEGFSSTGISIFVNTVHAGTPKRGLPEHAFGFLAMCTTSVEEIREIALKYGIRRRHNYVVADAEGNALSLESTRDGTGVVEPDEGVLVHSNHVLASEYKAIEDSKWEGMACSVHRYRRLKELMHDEIANRGKLSAVKVLSFMADHQNFPNSICRHTHPESVSTNVTSCTAVAEPTKGYLHIVRGNPCMNWPVTYSL